MIEVDILSGSGAIEEAAAEWTALYDRTIGNKYHQSLDYARHAWRMHAVHADRNLRVLIVRADGMAVLVWPFMLRNRSGLRQASWLGVYLSYRDLLVAPGRDGARWIDAAWTAAKHQLDVDLILCPAIREDSEAFDVLNGETDALTERQPTLQLNLEEWGSRARLDDELRSRFRSEIRRRLRRLQERGSVDIQFLDTPADIDVTLDWFFRHKARWAEHASVATEFDADYRHYVQSVCVDALSGGDLMFGVLTLDTVPLAAEIELIDGSRLEILMATYDPDWMAFGPGIMLFDTMLTRAFDTGMTVVDFRIGDEPYKRQYPVRESSLCSFLVPCSRRGRLLVLWRRLMSRARSQVRRLTARGGS